VARDRVHDRGRAFGGAERPDQEHRIDPRQVCLHSVRFGEVAPDDVDAVRQTGGTGVAGQGADGDTGFQQPVNDVPADLAGRPVTRWLMFCFMATLLELYADAKTSREAEVKFTFDAQLGYQPQSPGHAMI
jgi:hypothetical protein